MYLYCSDTSRAIRGTFRKKCHRGPLSTKSIRSFQHCSLLPIMEVRVFICCRPITLLRGIYQLKMNKNESFWVKEVCAWVDSIVHSL